MSKSSGWLWGTLIGFITGAIIALLFAPASGKETREKIAGKYGEMKTRFDAIKEKAGSMT
jgi:gas vesicle protein